MAPSPAETPPVPVPTPVVVAPVAPAIAPVPALGETKMAYNAEKLKTEL